jgi:hypothetical protein
MYFKSKKISLIILGITSLVCSRTMLVSFNDPEGPNLLIIAVMAMLVYFPSLAVYWLNLSITGLKRLLLAISIQVIVVTILYFSLR